MPILSYEEAAKLLVERLPEFGGIYEEHLEDNDEVLLHLLLPDLARFAVAAELSGDIGRVERVLAVVEVLFTQGDASTRNAVEASFVDHLAAESEPGEKDVVDRFPAALRDELIRQRRTRSPRG